MALIITYDDTAYHFDKELINIDEWRELKRKYKMTPKQFDESIGQADPDASTFLYWVMLRQAGDHRVPFGDSLKPDIIRLNQAVAAAVVENPEPEEEPDPTPAGSGPATTPSGDSVKATSTSSAASTSSPSPESADSQPATSEH
jgi:hypothetical protein